MKDSNRRHISHSHHIFRILRQSNVIDKICKRTHRIWAIIPHSQYPCQLCWESVVCPCLCHTHIHSLSLSRSVSVHTFARETRCLEINFVITLVFAIYHFSASWHRLRFIVWFNPTHYSSTASHRETKSNSGWMVVVGDKKMRAVRREMGNDVKPPPKWRMIKWKSGPEPLSNGSTLFYDSTLIGRS